MTNDEIFTMFPEREDGMLMWYIKKHGPDGCVLVDWPDSQDYMDEEWFDEEAWLDMTDKYGGSAYWIPKERLHR